MTYNGEKISRMKDTIVNESIQDEDSKPNGHEELKAVPSRCGDDRRSPHPNPKPSKIECLKEQDKKKEAE